MDDQTIAALCCPSCRGPLGSQSFDSASATSKGDLVVEELSNGILTCDACRVMFPVQNGIPVLLVFATNCHTVFSKKHHKSLDRFSKYKFPDGRPEQGERYVQNSFTDHWEALQEDELTYLYTDDDLVRLHRDVWLQWDEPPEDVRQVLNLGVGYGKETEILSRIIPKARIYGVDLNLSLLGRTAAFKACNVQFVIASVFHLPFRDGHFDLAYSQGVLHHTYSTKAAYSALQRQVRSGGYLFVWLYAAEDPFVPRGMVGFIAKMRWLIETLIRPPISLLPSSLRKPVLTGLAAVYHPMILARVRHRKKWTFKHSKHLTFDHLGPRYAHRHAFNEVIEWFEDDGFEIRVQSPSRYREAFGKRLFGVGLIGRRVR